MFKSSKKAILLTMFLGFTILLFTGCSNSEIDNFTVQNPDEYFLTSDAGNITNQEAFLMLLDNTAAIHILLELVDDALLRGAFEINPENTIDVWDEFKEHIPNVDEWLLQQGFITEEEVIRHLEVMDLRIATVRELDVDDSLIGELSFFEVIRLRAEADLEIFNLQLAADYREMLEEAEASETLANATSDVDDNVVARINNIDITIDQLFEFLSRQLAMDVVFAKLDGPIMSMNYTLDNNEVDEFVDGLRDSWGDEFDEIRESIGFDSDEELIAYVETMLLQQEAFRIHFTPDEERIQTLHSQFPTTAGASHILVDDLETANYLISQLAAASDNEFVELFAELAAEYSNCPSGAASGGDLGTWRRGQMVPEFDNTVFNELTVGEFTLEPVWNPTHLGYHIIYKTYRGELPDLEDVREDIIEQELAMRSHEFEGFLMTLRLNSGVRFSDQILQSIFESAASTN